jgi:peptidoglycan hydrolase CwlO-like protein
MKGLKMLKKRNVWVVLAGLVLISVVIPFVFAAEGDQTPPPPPGQGQRPRGQGQAGQGRGGDFQVQMLERAKTELAASDEAWKKIEPLLTKVAALNNEVNPRGMRGGRQGQGQPPAAPQGGQSEIQKAATALRTLTQDDASSMDDIKAKLADLRKVKEKAKEELAKTQEELKKNVDARQEAKLVLMGLLN